jgi:deazaflavin-dependent oxidoreductase (nitroreductase family)
MTHPRLGRRVARFNRRVTNRVTAPFARRLPGFGIVVHRGRRSGREHRTPVNVFRHGEGWVIALTYGTDAQWVRNVLAAGGCTLVVAGREHRLTEPRVVHDERAAPMPAPVRPLLRFMRVTDFLALRESA